VRLIDQRWCDIPAKPSLSSFRYGGFTIPHELGLPRSGSHGLFGALYPIYLRGEARLKAGNGAEAENEFQKVLDHLPIVLSDPIGALARLQLGRAFVLSGDLAGAKAAYRDFLSLWKDADADIPILKPKPSTRRCSERRNRSLRSEPDAVTLLIHPCRDDPAKFLAGCHMVDYREFRGQQFRSVAAHSEIISGSPASGLLHPGKGRCGQKTGIWESGTPTRVRSASWENPGLPNSGPSWTLPTLTGR
jgi:hypothetical protein